MSPRKSPGRRRTTVELHFSLAEILDLVVDMSRGGDPDSFIPTADEGTKIRTVREPHPGVIVTWKEK